MKKIPTLMIVDDFYDNPHAVRALADSLSYSPAPRSNYPGERTDELVKCAPEFYAMWEAKFLELVEGVWDGRWRFSTQFQRIPYNPDDPETNEGWVHCDTSEDIAGVVYLNPDAIRSSGTTLVAPKAGLMPQSNAHLRFRNDYYGGRNKITHDEFVQAKEANNKRFEDDIVIGNHFNRLTLFNCRNPHKQTKFGQYDDFRLTQIFFASRIKD